MLDGHARGLGARSHLVRRSGRNRISVARSTAGSSTIELQRERTSAETSCRGAPCESRTRLSGLEDRVLTARTTVRAEAEDGIEPSRCRSCNPAPSHLATRPVAGCRGVEPRWPDLESSLIPDRGPARWRAGGSNSARVPCKASLRSPFPHHGSNVNPRSQRPRCCPLHHAGLGWTARLELACQTFTASGLDSSPSSTVRPEEIESSSPGYRPGALPLSYRRSLLLCRAPSRS